MASRSDNRPPNHAQHGVSRRRQRISPWTEFSVSVETDPGLSDTVTMITCPLYSAPDGDSLMSLLLCLDGTNMCGLKVVLLAYCYACKHRWTALSTGWAEEYKIRVDVLSLDYKCCSHQQRSCVENQNK